MNDKITQLQEQIGRLSSNGPSATHAIPLSPVSTILQEQMNHPSQADREEVLRPLHIPLASHQFPVAKDPLSRIPQIEAIRLIEKFEEECASIYPFLDCRLVLNTTREAYGSSEVGKSPSNRPGGRDQNMFSGGPLDIVKLVIAIALVIEAAGPTNMSTELLESVESGYDGRFCGSSIDLTAIQVLTLMVCN